MFKPGATINPRTCRVNMLEALVIILLVIGLCKALSTTNAGPVHDQSVTVATTESQNGSTLILPAKR